MKLILTNETVQLLILSHIEQEYKIDATGEDVCVNVGMNDGDIEHDISELNKDIEFSVDNLPDEGSGCGCDAIDESAKPEKAQSEPAKVAEPDPACGDQ